MPNKFFQKLGKKRVDGGAEVRPNSDYLEEEIRSEVNINTVSETEAEVSLNMSANPSIELEEVCEDDDKSTPAPTVPDQVLTDSDAEVDGISDGNDSSVTISSLMSPSMITAIASTVVLLLLAWNLLFRRKQRRQRKRWKNDSKKILTRVEDVMLQLEERDDELDVLQQKNKTQQEEATKEQDRLKEESTQALEAKEKECQELKATVAELMGRQKETDSRLEKVAAELKHYVEGQQDHECQLLEQKLQASQLSTALADREAQIEQLQHTNKSQAGRIEELQQRIKSDAIKAEKIIGELTSERDDRFAILQQENDAIKTTVMGMLQQTQERYDSDKVLLKKEMRRRDEKIRSLQEELWGSNALLKRIKGEKGVNENLSQSCRNLIDDIKETKELATKSGKERRSSTFEAAETILEGDGECEELKELQSILQTPSKRH